MKQKILSTILASAVILSMTGCGGAQPTEIPSSQPSQNSEITASTTTSATTKKQEQTTTATTTTTTAKTTTTAPEEVSKPVKTLNVNHDSYGIYNGTWSFNIIHGEEYELYYYDIVNNKLIKNESAGRNPANLIGDFVYAPDYVYIFDPKTGNSVLDGCKQKDFNAKTELILVSKLDEGFSGNTFSLGVMNSKFEWVYPLTEITVDGMSVNNLDSTDYRLIGDYAVGSHGFAYSFKKNEIIEIPKIGDWQGENSTGDKVAFEYNSKLYVFDSNTEKTIQIGSSAYVVDDGIAVYDYESKKWRVLNWNDYKDMGFDLSEYEAYGIYAATEDYIAFRAKNPDGDDYTIIMKKDGSLVVDPIKGKSKSDYMHI